MLAWTSNGTVLLATAASVCKDISLLLLKYKHPQPTKPRLSPYKCLPIVYGSKSHITPDPDASELLNANCKRCVQEIVVSLLYYA